MPENRTSFSLDSYVTVAERIAAFVAKFPDGSLQSELVSMTESLVVVKAYAFRTPDDVRPGIGHSSLTIPGSTPYTRGSELENAESSAFGRAIAALGFEVKRGIATQNEIDSKREPEVRLKAPTNAEVAAERDRIAPPTTPIATADYDRIVSAGRAAKDTVPANYDAFQLWLATEFGGWSEFVKAGAGRVDEALAVLAAKR